MRPSAVILEVVPFYNGKGAKPGYREFRLKLPRNSAGLGAVDRYGFAPAETRPGPGLELRLMEQEHRFSALLGDQRHQFEQEALKRRIEDLEREVKTREKEVEILEDRL